LAANVERTGRGGRSLVSDAEQDSTRESDRLQALELVERQRGDRDKRTDRPAEDADRDV
jgi:hypothetical protein